MTPAGKSAVVGASMVLLAAIISGIGIWIAFTFSPILGILMALGGLIPWGWACFANKEFYAES